MKLSIDLEDITADHDFGNTIAEVVREEIHAAIRAAVRAEIKQFNAGIKAEVQKVARAALKEVKREKVAEIARRFAAEL
jgi:hypothetical protein